MSTNINWSDLNSRTIVYAASSIDAGITPPDGAHSTCARVQLYTTLSDFLAKAKQQFGADFTNVDMVRIIADTLVVDVETATFPVPAVEIVAREIQISAGPASFVIQSDRPEAQIMLLTSKISGNTLTLGYNAPGNPASVSTAVVTPPAPDPTPTLFQWAKGSGEGATLTSSTGSADIADVFAGLLERNSLQASFVAATVLSYSTDDDVVAVGGDMLRWANNCAAAGTANPDQLDDSAVKLLRQLQWQSGALLPYVDARNANAIYVPVLSSDFYQNEIAGWLTVAKSYEESLNALSEESQLDQAFTAFANNLAQNARDTITLLQSRFDRLYNERQSLQGEYDASVALFKTQQDNINTDRDALDAAIKKEETYETVMLIVNTIVTIYSLGVSAAEIFMGDPAPAMAAAKQVETVTQGIVVGRNSITFLQQLSKNSTPQQLEDGGNNLFKILGLLGEITRGSMEIAKDFYYNRTPKMPDDLNPPSYKNLTINGIDPETYWEVTYLNAKHQVDPLTPKFTQAAQYLDSIELMTTYGKAISAKQLAMINLDNEMDDIVNQIAVQAAAIARWGDIASNLQSQHQVIDAKKAFIRQTYTDMKRSLLVTVAHYRNAYLYRWLQPSTLNIDLNMDYSALQTQVQAINTDLENLLSGTGKVVHPPQDFKGITYQVPVGANQITSIGSDQTARWFIGIDDTTLSDQLTDHKALYLEKAAFDLTGAKANANGEVELTIETSGSYYLSLDGKTYHFITKAVSLDFIYKPSPNGNVVVTPWAVSDEVSQVYLRPSPYTEWTLAAKDGTDLSQVTEINIQFSGHYLREMVDAAPTT